MAAGRLDALYCGPSGDGWMPWDYCAGALFVEEAGGVMATLDHGEPFHVNSCSAVAAATRELCEEIHKCVDKGRAGTGHEAAYTTVIT